jgi:hypothetical protein
VLLKINFTTTFSLTGITLTVYMAVSEYQNQVIFNMTVFDGGALVCHIDTGFWVSLPKMLFLEYDKQVIFQYDAF